MKVASLIHAFNRCGEGGFLLVHTGQHYDKVMSADFFAELRINEPDINLNVGSGSHAEQTARVMIGFEQVCLEHKPDWVVVVGDVNSTMACAITAKKLGISVAHVEAGLRSRDMSMPEEINRLCTDAISDLLFTTDEEASANLRSEGVSADKIHFAGNTMIDTLTGNLADALRQPVPVEGDYAVLTLHRPSNVDSPESLGPILNALSDVASRIPILFPIHPRTRKNIERFGIELSPAIRLMEPLSYIPFIGLVARSRMVLTDSGGIQEETTVLGIPCITMRENTERPITCSIGTNILAGTDPGRIRDAALSVLDGNVRPAGIPPKWDGKAGERIVGILRSVAAGARTVSV